MKLTRALDALLVVGLGARLTRFLVTEDLALWTIRKPARDWAMRRNHTAYITMGGLQVQEMEWRDKLVSGLDCPFCVGTWVHLGSQSIDALVPRTGPLRTAWRVLALSQTAAYVLGHVGSRLGDAGYAEDDADPED